VIQTFIVLVFVAVCYGSRGTCDVSNLDKVDCGFSGTTAASCEAEGCCWEPVKRSDSTRDIPWCFYDSDTTRPPNLCDDGMIWSGAPDAGFTQEYYDIMYDYYLANLNIDGSGAVVAAPDGETPGGSYYYHWMRDAGLSIKAWLDINNNDYDKVRTELDAYAGWVAKVQHKTDTNNDVRIEPKFEIPSGEPYAGGWCRPQTDGPALRAMAMSKWGMILANTGNGDPSSIWEIVSFDMAWVTENWESEGCDLWEEVRSDDFFFNRMAYIYSLNVAADFGDMIGESGGAAYRAVAEEIKEATKSHWKDGFLYESTNRPYDGAVIHSIATFGEYLFPPSSSEAAATIQVLSKAFCNEYPINQEELALGKPGMLIGRYPGDSYAGGNPWQLLTAVFGELFYLGGQATYKDVKLRGDFPLPYAEYKEWMDLLRLQEGATAKDLAKAQVAAGDAVMTSLWNHVQDADGRMDEQIDKYTGVQTSAAGLTWSYANILHALYVRSNLDPGELTTTEPAPTQPPTGTPAPTGGPTSGTTVEPPQSCCNAVKFVSQGPIAQQFPDFLGNYRKISVDDSGKKVFKKVGEEIYLHYAEDVHFKFEAWLFSGSADDTTGDVINENVKDCADDSEQIWTLLNGNSWEEDATAQVECDGSNVECCSSVSLTSSGGTADKFPDLLGQYTQSPVTKGGQPVYTKDELYLYFLEDIPHHFEGWTVSNSLSELGSISNLFKSNCPNDEGGSWEFVNDSEDWEQDDSFKIDCEVNCCSAITVSSTGGVADQYPDLLGDYSQSKLNRGGQPVYTKGDMKLFYLENVNFHFEGWTISDDLSAPGDVANLVESDCPTQQDASWEFVDAGNSWEADPSMTVQCKN